MRGLDHIAKMRRQGFKPAHIVLNHLPYDAEITPLWVQYEPSDTPETHDLRPVVGMFTSVIGTDEQIVSRWASACLKAGAHTVLAEADGVETIHRLYGIDQ